MTRRWLSLTAACATAALAGCSQDPVTTPSGRPSLLLTAPPGSGPIPDEYLGDRPVHGAIFTTLPFGQAVNANLQYKRKIEVYLDGGPRGAAVPSTIVDLTADQPRVLRVGALAVERLREVLPELPEDEGADPA